MGKNVLSTDLSKIELAKEFLGRKKELEKIRNEEISGEEAISIIVSFISDAVEKVTDISYLQGIEEYNKGAEREIKGIIMSNIENKNIRKMVNELIEETTIPPEYIANHLMMMIDEKIEQLIGYSYFNLINKMENNEPWFGEIGEISDEELAILYPGSKFITI